MFIRTVAATSLFMVSTVCADQTGGDSISCALSPIVWAEPDGLSPRSGGLTWWFVNADRTMWAIGTHLHTGGNKVPWIRPKGTQLQISTRRLDAESPPARVDVPCCYGGEFQVSGIDFPDAGCWEVSASAGESSLTFVTLVRPSPVTEPDAV